MRISPSCSICTCELVYRMATSRSVDETVSACPLEESFAVQRRLRAARVLPRYRPPLKTRGPRFTDGFHG
jgi:hypothetical protein